MADNRAEGGGRRIDTEAVLRALRPAIRPRTAAIAFAVFVVACRVEKKSCPSVRHLPERGHS